MGRRRRRHDPLEDLDRMIPEQRDYLHIPRFSAAPSVIRLLEDRRQFAPAETYPRGLFRSSTRPVVRHDVNVNKARKNEVPRKVVFQAPMQVALCVRRKQRREVLFAMRRTGKGSKSKFRRRTEYSKMEC